MTEPYQPIACALHDEYEIAIMRKQYLIIKWTDEHGFHTGEVLPEDILVKNREEFLLAKTNKGESLCIRLDKIHLLEA